VRSGAFSFSSQYPLLSFPLEYVIAAHILSLVFPSLFPVSFLQCGPGNSVGIATDYGLDGPGIESRWGRDFPPVQTGPWAHPVSSTVGTRSFPGVKCSRGVLLTTHPLLVPCRGHGRVPTLWTTPGSLYLYLLSFLQECIADRISCHNRATHSFKHLPTATCSRYLKSS